MKTALLKILIPAAAIIIPVMMSGCGNSNNSKDRPSRQQLEKSYASIDPGTTIGSMVEVISPEFISLQGYAIVGELLGTGSAECPPMIRDYLKQYILRQLPTGNVEDLINSNDTAVVIVEGLMPTGGGPRARFDVMVRTPASAQTTSLDHGQLYGADLRAAGLFSSTSKVLAKAEGPVYIDKINPPEDKTVGYILGGGVRRDDYMMILALKEPDFLVSSLIRNRIIEKFGDKTANALSAGQIEINVPARYAKHRKRFLDVIKATHLQLNSEQKAEKIAKLVTQLANSADKYAAEVELEAIGNSSLKALRELLDSPDPAVQFHAARCMLHLDSDKGFEVLRAIAFDQNSKYRIEAIEAIASAAKRNNAAGVCRRLLRDDNIDIRLTAYEQLRNIDDIAIIQEPIGGNFMLEQIALTDKKMIFAARSGTPRIALFGGPIYCKRDLFIQSDDGSVTLNATPDQGNITIIRKIPGRADIPPISLECSYELSDIIQTLGAEPIRKRRTDRTGLNVSYSRIIALLHKMVEKQAIDCEFRAGPMPQISLK